MIFKDRRGELEIVNEMLQLALKDVKKTHLMYKTNLSYTVCSIYLKFLMEKNLLGIKDGNPESKIYFITDKGKKFLEEFKHIYDLVK